MLHLQLQRPRLPVTGHEPNTNEGKQEGGSQLAGAESWRPNPDERRECLTNTSRRAMQTAGFSIGVCSADKRDTDERSHGDQKAPPRARGNQFPPLFFEQPPHAVGGPAGSKEAG